MENLTIQPTELDRTLRWFSWGSLCIGVILGAISVIAYQRWMAQPVPGSVSPQELRREYVSTMQKRLALRPDQTMQLKAILEQTESRFSEAHSQYRTTLRSIRDHQQDLIEKMLTDSQQTEYQHIRAERAQRRQLLETRLH